MKGSPQAACAGGVQLAEISTDCLSTDCLSTDGRAKMRSRVRH